MLKCQAKVHQMRFFFVLFCFYKCVFFFPEKTRLGISCGHVNCQVFSEKKKKSRKKSEYHLLQL